jgi:glycosyltransferase involved in cell wall biosynthesis
MPVYNEERTVLTAIGRVLAVDYPCPVELIVVDDGSSDSTPAALRTLDPRKVRVIRQVQNAGKGSAVRAGVTHARGSHVLVLDADLEYAPSDIPALLEPVIRGDADHVFGTRIMGLNCRFPSFRYAVGGRLTTLAANLLYDSCLTDMHTCLKLLPLTHFRSLTLRENGFGLDTELTARLLRGGVRPYEVPISYLGRGFEDGKKISWRDGIVCLAILLKVRTERRPQHLLPAVAVADQIDEHGAFYDHVVGDRMSDLVLLRSDAEYDDAVDAPATA